jgi:hypothetical protein
LAFLCSKCLLPHGRLLRHLPYIKFTLRHYPGALSLHEHGYAFSRRHCARVFANVDVAGGHEGRPSGRFIAVPSERPLWAPTKPSKNNRKRNADRRGISCPHQRVRRAPRRSRLAPILRCGRARLSAFHHGTCGGEPTPPLSSRTHFPGLGRSARPRWFERSCAFSRALPRLRVPVQRRGRRPVIVPAGRFSGAAREWR